MAPGAPSMRALHVPRRCSADASSFTLEAVRGSLTNGIVSNPFLDQAFRTERYTIKVAIHADRTCSYEQDTLLIIPGQSEPFHHTDQNRLRKIAEPTQSDSAGSAADHQVKRLVLASFRHRRLKGLEEATVNSIESCSLLLTAATPGEQDASRAAR
jgi:hypothetical protein